MIEVATTIHGVTLTPPMKAVIVGCLRPGDVVDETTVSKETLEALHTTTASSRGEIMQFNASYESDRPDPDALKDLSPHEVMDAMLQARPCPIPLDTRLQSFMHIRQAADKDEADTVTIRRSVFNGLVEAARAVQDAGGKTTIDDVLKRIELKKTEEAKELVEAYEALCKHARGLEFPLLLAEQELRNQ